MARDPASSNTQAIAVASLGLAEIILVLLIHRNIITLDELKDILLKGSFSLEEEATKARESGHQARLTKDVKDLLLAILQRIDDPLEKPDKPGD